MAFPIPDVNTNHHDLSHHGRSPEKLRQLALVEEAEIKVFGEFLAKLATSGQAGSSLLDDPHDPHIGSILLVPELLIPLAIFALLEHGCCEVWRTKSGDLVGIESADDPERVEAVKRLYTEADNFVRRYAYAGTAGDRNRHQMTGRVM